VTSSVTFNEFSTLDSSVAVSDAAPQRAASGRCNAPHRVEGAPRGG
jgi:hypothetical protein